MIFQTYDIQCHLKFRVSIILSIIRPHHYVSLTCNIWAWEHCNSKILHCPRIFDDIKCHGYIMGWMKNFSKGLKIPNYLIMGPFCTNLAIPSAFSLIKSANIFFCFEFTFEKYFPVKTLRERKPQRTNYEFTAPIMVNK